LIEKGQVAPKVNRIYFLDNLRTFMIFLVVLYHEYKHINDIPNILVLLLWVPHDWILVQIVCNTAADLIYLRQLIIR
jgi:hypothetical protein